MEPGRSDMKSFRDLPNPSLDKALKAETRLAVKLSEIAAEFIQKLANAEKDHSNELSKVVKEFRGKTKEKRWSLFTSSTQFAAWEALLAETEQEAKCCMWYSQQLEQDVIKQLNELTTKKESLRKKWFEIRETFMSRVDKTGKRVEKLFGDYQSRWEEYAKCAGKAGGSDYVEERIVLRSYNAHNEYVMQLSAFNALHEEFYSKQIYDMLDELQALQEQAVEGFRTCMQKHAQLSRDKLDRSLQNHKDSSFPEKLKNINASADISSLVSGLNVGSEIYPPSKCDFNTPKVRIPPSGLPTLPNGLHWTELTQRPLTLEHESLKKEVLELIKGLNELQKEYPALHSQSRNPSLADAVTLLDKRNKIREKEADVKMVTAKLTLFNHLNTEGDHSSSLAEDSDRMSVRTDREDYISVASEESFRPESSDVFIEHELVEMKRSGKCSHCRILILPMMGMECQVCQKHVHKKCSKDIRHCTGEPPAKNPKSVSRRSSSSLSITNPKSKKALLQRQSTSSSPASSLTSLTPASPGNESALLQRQSTSSSPASSLTSPTPASPGNESATAYPNPFILPKSASIPEQEITPIRDKIVSTTRCEECARLKDELQEVKQRLYIELNAEIRKYQGDSKSADQIGTEYYNFFKDDILDMVWGVQNKTEPREQLCIIFQTIYSQVIKCVVRCATEKLNGLFEVPEKVAVDEATVNDMTRAYARLLSAANLTESQLTTEIQSHVASEISEELMRVSGISQAKMEHFVKRAISVAWSLVTAVPPLISSCDELTFRDDLHEKSSQWVDDRTDYKLKYTRPVLYTNSLGAVTLKGSVRNAEP